MNQRQIRKPKDIQARERIIRNNQEKIFVLGQKLAQDINDLGRDQLIISEIHQDFSPQVEDLCLQAKLH